MKVYLSGGTVTGWQEELMDHFEGEVEFYNPAQFTLGSVEFPGLNQYGPMDRIKVEECDIAFGYLEKSNPTPINVALEMGLAKGLGKITILCNEWTPEAFENKELRTLKTEQDGVHATWCKPHYVDLLNQWMDFIETDFGIAIEILKRVLKYELD